ncbi:hypothetical protein DB346_11010 [Verrucomicrobia bacterium LW23]|nr:hypothetical protein DB346_11010 [Verrucomicrobia bacterium LW23]
MRYTAIKYSQDKTEYEKCIMRGGNGIEEARLWRDRIVGRLINEIKLNFTAYKAQVFTRRASAGMFTDLTQLGISSAIAAVGGSEIKALLGLAGTALSGTSASVYKNLYQEKTPAIIIEQMDASFEAVYTRITLNLQKPVTSYSLERAYDDVIDLLNAGTLQSAFQEMAVSAAINRRNALYNRINYVDRLKMVPAETTIPAMPQFQRADATPRSDSDRREFVSPPTFVRGGESQQRSITRSVGTNTRTSNLGQQMAYRPETASFRNGSATPSPTVTFVGNDVPAKKPRPVSSGEMVESIPQEVRAFYVKLSKLLEATLASPQCSLALWKHFFKDTEPKEGYQTELRQAAATMYIEKPMDLAKLLSKILKENTPANNPGVDPDAQNFRKLLLKDTAVFMKDLPSMLKLWKALDDKNTFGNFSPNELETVVREAIQNKPAEYRKILNDLLNPRDSTGTGVLALAHQRGLLHRLRRGKNRRAPGFRHILMRARHRRPRYIPAASR